jgi:hypothetical protein
LAPQSNVLGPVAAAADELVAGVGSAAALADGAGAGADSAGAGALGSAFGGSGFAAAALGAGVVADGLASGVAVPSGLLSLQPHIPTNATTAANRTRCFILISFIMASEPVFLEQRTPNVLRRGDRPALPGNVPGG